jgi:hypothetical protein
VRRIVIFYLIAFGITWAGEFAVILSGGFKSASLIVLYSLAFTSPTIAAIAVTHWEGGSPAVRRLLRQALFWRWTPIYLIALTIPNGIRLVALYLSGWRGPWWSLAPADVFGYFPLLFLAPMIFEEFGWRGYALPRLQERWNPLLAGLITGLLWALWHLPIWFLPANSAPHGLLPFYFLWQTAAGVVSAWAYNASGRLLTAAMVFHVGLNLGLVATVPASLPYAAIGMAAVAALLARPLSRAWTRGGQPSAPAVEG